MPQNPAGCLMEPPVSDPKASGASRALTATAEPPEEPPGVHLRFHGFFVLSSAEFSVDEPMANSSRFVLPIMMASSSKRSLVAVASKGALKFVRNFEPQVVIT